MIKKTVILLVSLLYTFSVEGQNKEEAFTMNGYLSTLQRVVFNSLSGPFTNDNLIHNRLNFKGYLNKNITLTTELRNRLFTGDLPKMGNAYSKIIGTDPGWVDMSWNLIRENSYFLNATIDRLSLNINSGKFEARIGRQRINWAQTFIWNPNDIFNTYSFFDFDYVERPGCDAIRIQYYPTFSSDLELAAKLNHKNKITLAGLWRFNRWHYDIQFLAGYLDDSGWMAGTGWSGNIGSVSFRGEVSLFQSGTENLINRTTGIFTIGLDKMWKDNSMFQMQLMYCNHPYEISDFNFLYTGNLSAKDLAFSKFTTFGQFTWATTPLLNLGLSAMWFPDLKGYYAGPTLEYSLAENVDFMLVWQHFDGIISNSNTKMNLGYLRLKYSF